MTLLTARNLEAQTTPRYRVIDLTTLNFVPNVKLQGSMGINSHGEVVYGKMVDGQMHPWVWLPESLSAALPAGFNDLYTLTSKTGIARDINDDHIIAGQHGAGNYYTRDDVACVWDLEAPGSGYFFSLGTLGVPDTNNDWSGTNAINNDDPPIVVGQVAKMSAVCGCVGQTSDGNTHFPAFKTTFEGSAFPTLTLLSPSSALYPAPNSSSATGLSTVSPGSPLRIAGSSFCRTAAELCSDEPIDCTPAREATYWASTAGANLSVFTYDFESSGRRMSDDGHVAGWGFDHYQPPLGDPTCLRHPLYWDSVTSTHTDLQQYLPSGQAGNACWAESVSNGTLPAVVGWDETFNDAMLWEKQSGGWTALNLNTPAAITCASQWDVLQAHDINDDGWITAIARDKQNDSIHAVLLVPYFPCAGDLNDDCEVNVDDLLLVINNWGACPPPCPPCEGNTNQDCTVNVDDLLAVINGWGSCGITGGTGAPESVSDCMSACSEAAEYADCMEACIESLCIRGILPDCD